MGSSSNDPTKDIDSSAGSLVWVRRRNGSWWPGRILGPGELPENCLSMPRLGTPVKLLGREDASVDWYNLDKSKRIKAFRCGEYDDCIEKAKATSSHLSKRAVKYARREDAIIQALELESAQLGKEHPNYSVRPGVLDEESNHIDESPSSFHTTEESDDIDEDLSGCDGSDSSCSSESSKDDAESAQELSQSGASFEESDIVDSSKEGSRRWRTPNDTEDDGTECVKRMRGLEDLGMGVASSLKRKRSQVAHVHEFLKRKNRRRTLTKVLECTPVLPVLVCALSSPNGSSAAGTCDEKVSVIESNESKNVSVMINNNSENTGVSCENGTSIKKSEKTSNASLRVKQENESSSVLEVLESDSPERLFDVSLVTEGKQSAGNASQKALISYGAQPNTNHPVGNEERNEPGSTGSGTTNIHNISQMVEKGTSDWRLKGKRNSRSRKAGLDDGTDTGGHHNHEKSRQISEIQLDECRGWNWKSCKESRIRGSIADPPGPIRSLPYRQSRFTVNPKFDSYEFSLRHHIASSGLYDVPVEVNASYRPQQVPYISLMSKVNGQPIVGHPITIEKLTDGFCDHLLNMVKRNTSTSKFDCILSQDASALQHVDTVYRQRSRGRPPRRYGSPRSPNLPPRPTKSRRNTLLSKKTRKLSTLDGTRKSQETKPIIEKIKAPSLACVPLTVVFSRINAAMK